MAGQPCLGLEWRKLATSLSILGFSFNSARWPFRFCCSPSGSVYVVAVLLIWVGLLVFFSYTFCWFFFVVSASRRYFALHYFLLSL